MLFEQHCAPWNRTTVSADMRCCTDSRKKAQVMQLSTHLRPDKLVNFLKFVLFEINVGGTVNRFCGAIWSVKPLCDVNNRLADFRLNILTSKSFLEDCSIKSLS